jgi:hypothetical protein
MLTTLRPTSTTIVTVIAIVLAVATAGAATPGEYSGGTFAVKVDNPTVKLGARALIVATIAPAEGYRITDAYRHRIVNLSATDDGV